MSLVSACGDDNGDEGASAAADWSAVILNLSCAQGGDDCENVTFTVNRDGEFDLEDGETGSITDEELGELNLAVSAFRDQEDPGQSSCQNAVPDPGDQNSRLSVQETDGSNMTVTELANGQFCFFGDLPLASRVQNAIFNIVQNHVDDSPILGSITGSITGSTTPR